MGNKKIGKNTYFQIADIMISIVSMTFVLKLLIGYFVVHQSVNDMINSNIKYAIPTSALLTYQKKYIEPKLDDDDDEDEPKSSREKLINILSKIVSDIVIIASLVLCCVFAVSSKQ